MSGARPGLPARVALWPLRAAADGADPARRGGAAALPAALALDRRATDHPADRGLDRDAAAAGGARPARRSLRHRRAAEAGRAGDDGARRDLGRAARLTLAYLASFLIVERIYRAGEAQLLSYRWLACWHRPAQPAAPAGAGLGEAASRCTRLREPSLLPRVSERGCSGCACAAGRRRCVSGENPRSPHPEEPRSSVSKDAPAGSGASTSILRDGRFATSSG